MKELIILKVKYYVLVVLFFHFKGELNSQKLFYLKNNIDQQLKFHEDEFVSGSNNSSLNININDTMTTSLIRRYPWFELNHKVVKKLFKLEDFKKEISFDFDDKVFSNLYLVGKLIYPSQSKIATYLVINKFASDQNGSYSYYIFNFNNRILRSILSFGFEHNILYDWLSLAEAKLSSSYHWDYFQVNLRFQDIHIYQLYDNYNTLFEIDKEGFIKLVDKNSN